MENFISKIIESEKKDNLKFRFSPENNGYLHIGHAKSICLNFGLSEKYNGKCNLRFDDTNPSSEKLEYINSILDDIKWLGYNPSEILYASDYYEIMYNIAIFLIKNNLAYVCELSSKEITEYSRDIYKPGKESPYRNRTVNENLLLFEDMKNGKFKDGTKSLRAKIDMSSPNIHMRDPIIYRIKSDTHYRLGDKWKIYPMYDFAHPISDYIENITYSNCTLEFEAHKDFYIWLIDKLKNFMNKSDEHPTQIEFARLNIDYTVMSKRKLKRLVDEGFVNGWDDPRMPTISGLKRRGYTPEAIREFCDRVGVTRHDSLISYNLLEECLRVDLNKRANRLMGVMDPIKVVITNWIGGTEMIEVENNPEDESAGKRMVPFSGEIFIEGEDFREEADNKFFRLKPGGEVRLKGAYIIKANEIIKEGDKVIAIKCTYDPLTKSGMPVDRKIKGTIHWVSVEHGVNVEVREYGKLFSDATPDKYEDDFVNYLAKDSLIINNKAVFEPAVLSCESGVPVQMVRKGYYVRDIDSKNLVFNKTVSLKEDKNK